MLSRLKNLNTKNLKKIKNEMKIYQKFSTQKIEAWYQNFTNNIHQ